MLVSFVLCLATSTGPVVLMPVEGGDVLPAVREAVDAVVREAATSRLGPRLQTAADTEAIVADAVAAGLNCSLRDVACGVRVGAIAGASEVLVPVVKTGTGSRLEIAVTRLDVGRGSAVAVGATVIQVSDVAGVAAFLGTLLDPPAAVAIDVDGGTAGAVVVVDDVAVGLVPLAAPVAMTVGSHTIAVVNPSGTTAHRRAYTAAEGFQRVAFAAQVTPRAEPSGPASTPPLFAAGAATAGAGGLLLVGGGGLAMLTEVGLAIPRDGAAGYAEDRAFGRLMLVTAALGAVVVAGGGALMLMGDES